jgi:chromosome segregation ATPase
MMKEEARLNVLTGKCNVASQELKSLNEKASMSRTSIKSNLADAQNQLNRVLREVEVQESALNDVNLRVKSGSKIVDELKHRKDTLTNEVRLMISAANQFDIPHVSSYFIFVIVVIHLLIHQVSSLEGNVIGARASLARLSSAMKRVSEMKFESFEQASRELSIRHDQVHAIICRIENFQSHCASWTEEKQDLEREKLKLHMRVVGLERGLDNKSTQIDQQTQKLKDLMKTITLQDERLQKKQRFIEKKATELALYEQNVRKESDKNSNLYQLMREERNAIESLQKELEDKLQEQKVKEIELARNEQRLLEMERDVHEEQEKSNEGKQRMHEVSNQLQKRHEEVSRQRKLLEDREKQCNEYEARLRSWEEQLEHVTNLLQQGGGAQQHQQNSDADSFGRI